MPADYRVPMVPVLEAFGVAITVTVPPFEDDPVATTGVWVTSITQDVPFGTDFQRRERRRVLTMALSSALASVPRGSVVYAPEFAGGTVLRWRVDGFEVQEADHVRAVLVPDFELE